MLQTQKAAVESSRSIGSNRFLTGTYRPSTTSLTQSKHERIYLMPTKTSTVAKKTTKPSRRKAEAQPSNPVGHQKTSTPSTTASSVEIVEVVDATTIEKPEYDWQMEAGLDRNFMGLGKLLKSMRLSLYRHSEGGLVRVDGDRIHRVTSAKELGPLLIDHVRIHVSKNGKYHAEKPSITVLNDMLLSRSFLDNFAQVGEIVTTPIALRNFKPSLPGWNQGGILHLGPTVTSSGKMTAILKFLDVMDWQSHADRTNAVAALLTVPLRQHFLGGKPLVLVTANKSHAGKGTVVDFIRGNTSKAELLYESIDWPMQRSLHEQVSQYPEIGLVNIDNVRTDSAGRGKIIRSGFVESVVTSSEIMLTSTSRKPVRMPNRFLFLLNTNIGSLSVDLLNRSLPIRLNPTGDLQERIARSKATLGGDVKHDWLPAHRDQIQAEAWGMIDRWDKAGKPHDANVKHPMGPWAQVVGGILMVNGFEAFLDNYNSAKSTADPVREALSILALHAAGQYMRASMLAKIAVTQGLAKTLLPNVDSANQAACERALGMAVKSYIGETFTAVTATSKITFRLHKKQGRFDEKHPHFRYVFEEVSRQAAVAQDLDGLVLEEKPTSPMLYAPADDLDLNNEQPEAI